MILTIGYEQHQAETLVRALVEARVERLLDVRELPMSRRQGFSKTALREHLARAGIVYEHDRRLGNPKPYRDLYRSGRQVEGEAAYLAHLRNGSAEAVDQLSGDLAKVRTCLMCFEHDHQACHRNLVVEELRLRCPSLRVEHL
jgi:uncharacterized protein (DUF488 family)